MFAPASGRTCRRGALVGVVLAVALGGARSAGAALSDNLQGYVDVTATQDEINGIARNSLRQQYTANWSKQLVPFVVARASFRYFRFDIEDEVLPRVTREELQPSGELLWKHPEFTFTTSARRRTLKVRNIPGRRIGDNLGLSFRTRNLRYPRLSVRYDFDHIFNVDAIDERSTKDRRLQTRLDYATRGNDLAYSFTHRRTDNVVSRVRGTEDAHVFWWNAPAYRPHPRLTLTSSYTFTHRTQTQEQTDGGPILTVIPRVAGRYAEDLSPEFGELDPLPGLSDLNTVEPTVPPVDIGGALTHRNLGLDLGFETAVTVIYVYTDRPSGVQPTWNVWVSRDNLEWDLWDASPSVERNPESNRYEIAFSTVSTRYVKVLNLGVNEEPEVFVTELEALVESDEEGKVSRRGGGHLLDFGMDYDVTRRVSSSLDASYENEPFFGASGDRERGDYAIGAKFRQSRMVLHQARWQQGFQEFADNTVRERTNAASYTLLIEPLETLRFTTSLDGREDIRNGEKLSGSKGVVFRVFGMPVPGANLSSDVGRSRNEQPFAGMHQDVWSFRASGDGALTRSIDLTLSYLHQRVTSQPEDELRIRNQYGLGFEYHVTRTIFARGAYNLTREGSDEVTQDYLVSWNTTPKLTLSSQAFFVKTRLGRSTERYNANVTYTLSARSTLYASYSIADFTEIGGAETRTFQAGLRAGI